MSLQNIIAMSFTEIIGDTAFKKYANNEGTHYLSIGVLSYICVIILLIINLQGSTLLMVNNAWDGTSSLLESIFAYVVLGERFTNYLQYIGVGTIIIGLYLLKIPLKKSHPFIIPKN